MRKGVKGVEGETGGRRGQSTPFEVEQSKEKMIVKDDDVKRMGMDEKLANSYGWACFPG